MANSINLAQFFNQMKQYHGLWVARDETYRQMRINMRPQDFGRPRLAPWQVATFNVTHAIGQRIAKAFGSGDVAEMLACYRSDESACLSTVVRQKLYNRIAGNDAVTECCCCGGLMLVEEGRDVTLTAHSVGLICESCYGMDRTVYSDPMDAEILRSSASVCFPTQEDFDNSDTCYCLPDWARDNGYTRRSGTWYGEGVINTSQSEINDTIFGYHDGPELGHIPSEYDSRKPRVLLGMELEVENICDDGDENVENRDIARSILKTLNGVQRGFVKAETDGSLDNGFELVTGYTGLDVHAKVWSKLKDARYFEEIQSHSTDTCGLHVHVDKAGMTPLHAAKLAAFINSRDNEKLMHCVARRYNGSYARFDREKNFIRSMARTAGYEVREAKRYHRPVNKRGMLGREFHSERYSAVNFNNEHTVEFRMFRGTLKFESIMACLEFAFETWHFTQQAPMNGLTTEAFMAFICRPENRKDSRHLRAYLKAKKFRAFYQAEGKVVKKAGRYEVPTDRQMNAFIHDEPEAMPLGYAADALAYQRQRASAQAAMFAV